MYCNFFWQNYNHVRHTNKWSCKKYGYVPSEVIRFLHAKDNSATKILNEIVPNYKKDVKTKDKGRIKGD